MYTSTAEFAALNKVRGFPVGESSINSMILVDDIANVNSCTDDVIVSHQNFKDFRQVKRLPANGSKCFILPINCKNPHLIPSLEVDGVPVKVVDVVTYVGAVFNKKGDNKDKIKDRVQKGKTCMIEALSLCCEITLGMYMIQSLVLTHNSMFLPTLLYGAQVWTNMTKEDEKAISILQLQFLKRIVHAPASACNSITYFELGVLPVSYEVDLLKLNFLHHIVSLEDSDPVRHRYEEQKKLVEEKNWANECTILRTKYYLGETDVEVSELAREEWKEKVYQAVREIAVEELNREKNSLGKCSSYPDAEYLHVSQYLSHFQATQSCLLFRVRSRIVDVKEFHHYKYPEDNRGCRACGQSIETLAHVLGECNTLHSPTCDVGDEYSEDLSVLEKVVVRTQEFMDKVEELEEL